MLLPSIVKINAVIILSRVFKAARERIPKGKIAYQPGRGTYEQSLAVKILYKKAIVTEVVPICTKLIDIFRAIDNVCRNLPKIMFKCIIDDSSFILLELVLDRIDAKVRVRKYYSKNFATSKGVPQGDAPSRIVFILYLLRTLAGVFTAPGECNHDLRNPRIRFSVGPSLSVNTLQ